jgi:hypothetical protein
MSVGIFYGFAIMIGFVLAGLAGSFFRLVTRHAISFELAEAARPHLAFGIATLMFAGPAVIMRNAVRARLVERRALFWLALSSLIAVTWSFLAGLMLLYGLYGFNVLDGHAPHL